MRDGCFFWFILVPLIILLGVGGCVASTPMGQAAQNNAAARKAEAQAAAAKADAEKIYAQGYSDAMGDLVGAATSAIRADTNAAHPLQYLLRNLITAVIVICAIVAVVGLALLMVWIKLNLLLSDDVVAPVEIGGGKATCANHGIIFYLANWATCPVCQFESQGHEVVRDE